MIGWLRRLLGTGPAAPDPTVPMAIYEGEIKRGQLREAALMAEIRNLTDKLTALGDVRAQRSVSLTTAPRQEPDPDKPRPSIRMPASIQSMIAGGHVDMRAIRQEMATAPLVRGRSKEFGRAAVAGADFPPVAE